VQGSLPTLMSGRRALLAVIALVVVVGAGCAAVDPVGEITFAGPDRPLLNADDLSDLLFEVIATDDLDVDGFDILHRGESANRIERSPQRLAWVPSTLEDGEHTVTVVRDNGDDEHETVHTWTFTVDATPPEIEVTDPTTAVVAGAAMTVVGTTEPGATLAVGGVEVTADDDGAFEAEVPEAQAGPLTLTATDLAGNTSETEIEILTVPSRVTVDTVRGLHMTQHSWVYPPMRDGVLAMIDEGKVNTVVLTLKDESGRVGHTSEVPLAVESGANQNVHDLAETVAELHSRGVHVIGRVVAFRDPVLGAHAKQIGEMSWLIRGTDGQPYEGRYGCCFTNFANPDVIEYNLAIAEEAAALGVDVILWDYIRRPEGPIENIVIEGLTGTPEEGIVDFTALAAERLAPYGVGHGVSVYGIAATRPRQMAQDIGGMAPHVDIVAPMVYPSHWGLGEYGVTDPNRQPYDIVFRSLERFVELTEGTRARVVPWLEDTTYRAWDRPLQIREQQRGAADRDILEWMMWDPRVRYTPGAYVVAE
jgi:hypothetical protein